MSEFLKVASKKDLPEGKAVAATIGNKQIAVFNVGGKFYAIDDACSHAGGSLAEGSIQGTTVTCPWHGAEFDITSGAALSAPAFDGVSTYQIQIDGDDIKVAV